MRTKNYARRWSSEKHPFTVEASRTEVRAAFGFEMRGIWRITFDGFVIQVLETPHPTLFSVVSDWDGSDAFVVDKLSKIKQTLMFT